LISVEKAAMNNTMLALLSSWRHLPVFNAPGEGAAGGATGNDGGANGGGASGTGDAGAQGNGEPRGDGTGAGGDTTVKTGGDDPSAWTYELSYPETFGIEGERMEEWTGLLREIGVSPEQAAKIAEKEIEWFEATQAQTQEMLDGYTKAVDADKYLSENWDLTVKRMEAGLTAAKVSPEFREFLASPDGVMIAAHPDIIRAFAMLGQTTSNDKFDTGQTSEATVPAQRSWYGNTTPETKRG
jgi:hypothetical protein